MSPPASHRHIVICSSIACSGFSRGNKQKRRRREEAVALRAESRVRPQPFPHLEPPCDGEEEEEEEEGCGEVSAVRGAERIRDFFLFFHIWFFTS